MSEPNWVYVLQNTSVGFMNEDSRPYFAQLFIIFLCDMRAVIDMILVIGKVLIITLLASSIELLTGRLLVRCSASHRSVQCESLVWANSCEC